MRDALISVLEKSEFQTFVPLKERSCFDIAARKGKTLLLIKVLNNIDSLREVQANELKRVCSWLNANPLLVGIKSKSFELKEGLVYERYGVQAVTIQTLSQLLLENVHPEKRFFKGRVVVDLNTDVLEKSMKDEKLSVKQIASELRISREAVYQYLRGKSRIEFGKAKEMESLLKKSIISEISLFSKAGALPKARLSGTLKDIKNIGFEVIPINRGFDAFAKEKDSLIVDLERDASYAKKKAEFLKSAGGFFDNVPVYILEARSAPNDIKGIPVIRKGEIKEFSSPGEFLEVIRKRKKYQ